MSKAINIKEKLSQFSEQWTPYIIGEMDDYCIKLSKIEGDFVFHKHDEGDEMFLVIKGRFRMDYEDSQARPVRQEWVEEGEMIVVPKGVMHKPFAETECELLVIEQKEVINTGDSDDGRRVEQPNRI